MFANSKCVISLSYLWIGIPSSKLLHKFDFKLSFLKSHELALSSKCTREFVFVILQYILLT